MGCVRVGRGDVGAEVGCPPLRGSSRGSSSKGRSSSGGIWLPEIEQAQL